MKDAEDIIIPDTVTGIGAAAFRGLSSLTSVTIPNSVTSIDQMAFSECINLKNITIPDSITSIKCATFNNCSSLTSISIPDSVTSIEDFAFSNCISLMSINIPSSVRKIGKNAFESCKRLKSISIPDSVKHIEEGVFYNCSHLTSVTIPSSVKKIEKDAFMGAARIERLDIFGGSDLSPEQKFMKAKKMKNFPWGINNPLRAFGLRKAPVDRSKRIKPGVRLAPNGKPSNLNKWQYLMVRTKAFKEWFGDWENDPEHASKMLDENGEPEVLWHGSATWNPFASNKVLAKKILNMK